MNNTIRTWIKDGLWVIVFAGLVASIIRFTRGLGISTGMNDSAPWGLWIAFKLVFVALAGGGFTLAALVYVFHLERFRPILRRAILIALLGYGSFIVSLIFDLGLPWHIYMPVISWQHHSVMFEIAWCVMLYFSVLVLEFSPAILEHPWFNRPVYRFLLDWLHRLTSVLIIAGIVLSTLHQSSLGSLFLIMPHRVHPLWYSPWIPYQFFTSAIAAGMLALILEGFLVARWFKQKIDLDLLRRLGRGAVFPLGIYLVLRIADLLARGVLPGGLDGSWQSLLFLAEIVLGGFLPIFLLTHKKISRTREGLLTAGILAILGIMSQRMSLSMFTMFRPEGSAYVPALGEILIAFAIPAASILVYLFFAENLNIFSVQPKVESPALEGSRSTLYSGFRRMVAHRSGLAIFVIALSVPSLGWRSISPTVQVRKASGWEMLTIDGNRSGYEVTFPHLDHQLRLVDEAGESDCQTCHHMDLPDDQDTACWECHRYFYQATSIFNHNLHQRSLGGNDSCLECHTQEHLRLSAGICQDCHDDMAPEDGQAGFNMLAVSYKDALHGRCLTCHEAQSLVDDRPDLALCSTCHTTIQQDQETIAKTW